MKCSSALWLRLMPVLVSSCLLSACGSSEPTVSPTRNPLVAQYSVPTSQAGDLTVEFGPDTSYGKQTASYPVVPGFVPILVAGMKPSTTYHMRAQLSVGGSVVWSDKDRTFTTGAVAAPLPAITVTRTTDSALQATENPGVELVTYYPGSGTSVQTLVTDRDGNPIWYYAPPGDPQYFKFMPNGHVLVHVLIDGADSVLREIDLAGTTVRELDFSTLQQELANTGQTLNFTGFSHDFIPMENGHVIVLGITTKDFTDLPGYPGTTTVIGDALVDLDENWHPVWVWSAFDHLDVNRHPMFFPDWTHSNAVVYNPNDGNLLLSMRHQSWIIDIDYQNGSGSGNILWRLGNEGDFILPGSDPSLWFSAQHFPSFIDISGTQMTLAVFDNGDFRPNGQGTNCGNTPYPACYSRATVFQLDQSTMQVQTLWQFLPGFYSFWGGSISQLENGNIEFAMSEPFPIPTLGSRIMEVTQSESPEMVWQMDLTGGSSYRSYRIPSLYPNVTWH